MYREAHLSRARSITTAGDPAEQRAGDGQTRKGCFASSPRAPGIDEIGVDRVHRARNQRRFVAEQKYDKRHWFLLRDILSTAAVPGPIEMVDISATPKRLRSSPGLG